MSSCFFTLVLLLLSLELSTISLLSPFDCLMLSSSVSFSLLVFFLFLLLFCVCPSLSLSLSLFLIWSFFSSLPVPHHLSLSPSLCLFLYSYVSICLFFSLSLAVFVPLFLSPTLSACSVYSLFRSLPFSFSLFDLLSSSKFLTHSVPYLPPIPSYKNFLGQLSALIPFMGWVCQQIDDGIYHHLWCNWQLRRTRGGICI